MPRLDPESPVVMMARADDAPITLATRRSASRAAPASIFAILEPDGGVEAA